MIKINSHTLPVQFVENISSLDQGKGKKWLDNLQNTIDEVAVKWQLKMENPFPNLSYHYVAPCTCADGKEAVLKIGFPEENSVMRNEAKVLRYLKGDATVKILKFDETMCAMLLERLLPGENLVRICKQDDVKSTAIAIHVMKKFCRHAPQNHDFPSLTRWTGDFQIAAAKIFPKVYLEKAQNYFRELINESKQYLLHGDLHHQNILSAERESFLAIDPKGIVGDIGFEISVFLNNPRSWILNHPNKREILKKRIEMFSQNFEIKPLNLRKWAYAEAVLSAWWTFQDNGTGWEKWLEYAEIWETITT